MYHVLLPIDGDEQRAKRIAEAFVGLPLDTSQVDALVLNVFAAFKSDVEGGLISPEDYFEPEAFPESVDVVLEKLRDAGIDADKRRVYGDPAEEIIAAAEDFEADLIAMGGRKRSPAGKVLFGSVTQSVLLSGTCPVLVTTRK